MAEQRPLDEMAEWCARQRRRLRKSKPYASHNRAYADGIMQGLKIVMQRCRTLGKASGRAPTNKEE